MKENTDTDKQRNNDDRSVNDNNKSVSNKDRSVNDNNKSVSETDGGGNITDKPSKDGDATNGPSKDGDATDEVDRVGDSASGVGGDTGSGVEKAVEDEGSNAEGSGEENPSDLGVFMALISSLPDHELEDEVVESTVESVTRLMVERGDVNPVVAASVVFEKTDESLVERLDTAVDDALWVARMVFTATRKASQNSLMSGFRIGARMTNAAISSRSPEEFLSEYEDIAFDELEKLSNGEIRGEDIVPDQFVEKGPEVRNERNGDSERDSFEKMRDLRERGTRLLEMSADVENDELHHPAFSHILEQISPDEARILRFIATEGPQPAVDVRDVGWLPVSSDLAGAGMTMLATESGCRHEDRIQAYLNNLEHLGVIWFSREPIENYKRYQLLEAQPDVKDAIDSCKRAKIVRRSIVLTPLGVDFCRVCFPIEVHPGNLSKVYKIPNDRYKDADESTREKLVNLTRRSDSYDIPEGIKNPYTNEREDR